jgi:hypothetical protein
MSSTSPTPFDEARIAYLRAYLQQYGPCLLDDRHYADFAEYGIAKDDLERALNIMAAAGEVVFGVETHGIGIRLAGKPK